MKTGTFFCDKSFQFLVMLPLFTLWFWPLPVLADAAVGIGLLGGALVGSLIGPPKNSTENAMIGAAVGGTLAHLGTTDTSTTPSNTLYLPKQPMTAQSFRHTRSDPIECRPLQTQGFVNGRQETLVGTACRTRDNIWQYQDSPRIVRNTVIYQEPQTIFVEPVETVTVYPAPHTAWVEPRRTITRHPGEHRGRYYGHRDHWRREHHSHTR